MTAEKYSNILGFAVVGTFVALTLATIVVATYAYILKPLFKM